MILVVEIGDHKVRPAVPVDISRIHAHSGFGHSVAVIGHLGVETVILEFAIALFVTGYPACALFHDNRDGTFTEVTEKAGVPNSGKWGASAVDYDRDGLL